MLVLGIDPGLTGAVAVLGEGGRVLMAEPIPTVYRGGGKVKREVDAAGIVHLLRPYAREMMLAAVEAVASRPGQGVASTFSLGHSLGVVCGVLAALAIPYRLVPPAAWKRHYGLPAEKEAARALATRLYPEVPLHRKADHGLAEALLIARYGAATGGAA